MTATWAGLFRRHRHEIRKASRGVAILVCGLALAGCGSVLGGGPPPILFQLSPKSSFDPGLPEIGVQSQLVVEQPESTGALNTNRIAVKPQPLQLDYYAAARWSERAPLLVQTLLLESFENTGKIISVGREALGLRPDYSLRTEMREFQAQYFDRTGTTQTLPNVLVQLNAKLIQMPQERIFDSRNFEACVTANSAQIEDVVRAFDAALGGVMKDIVQWTLRGVAAREPFGRLARGPDLPSMPDRSACEPL